MGVLKVWSLSSSTQLDHSSKPHETSINSIQLLIGLEPEHARVWTASSDHTVLLSQLDLSKISENRIISLLRLEQPYYIRCALQITLPALQLNWLVTGSTDEQIRIYDLDKEDEEEEDKEEAWMGMVEGHWHEVNGLAVWDDGHKNWILSTSLDGTLRKWELNELKNRFMAGTQPLITNVETGCKMELSAEE